MNFLFKPALNLVIGIIVGDKKERLLNQIKLLDATTLTDSEKRNKAFDSIKRDMSFDGKKVRDSMINLAIEAAVVYLSKY